MKEDQNLLPYTALETAPEIEQDFYNQIRFSLKPRGYEDQGWCKDSVCVTFNENNPADQPEETVN